MLFALAQVNPTAGALEQNSARIVRYFKKAQARGADLVIYPEAALTGAPLGDLLIYEDFIDKIGRIAAEELAPLTKGSSAAMLVGAPFRQEGRLYNGALLMEGGRLAASYPKAVLEPELPFEEERYFSPAPGPMNDRSRGGVTLSVVTGAGALSPGGAALPQRSRSRGKRLLISPVASPFQPGRRQQREVDAAALAQEQQSALLVANLIGGGDELVFDGSSLAYNCRGELIARAASFTEEIVYLSAGELFSPASAPLPALPEEGGEEIFQALVLGLKDYFIKNGFTQALLGLSGGLDSAVTAALAAEALGPENVLGVLLPSPYSPAHSLEDALALAENLGIASRTIPIAPFFQAYLAELNRSGKAELDLAEENLQARIRGNILMLIANRERRLLLTTGNRSELAVGYCTMYGDMAGALAVLADLPKLTVYELARAINRRQKAGVIPENTITKPPSAELSPGQLDEDSLPPYRILDPILSLYLDEGLSPAAIIERGFDAATVRNIIALVNRAEHKRRQAAPPLRVISGPGRRRTPLTRWD